MGYKTKLSNAYHATMSGYLVNLGIPRSGEVSRCAMLAKTDKVPLNVLVGTVLSERILDLVMLGLVVFGAVVLQFDLLYGYIYENVIVKIKDNGLVLIFVSIIGVLGLFFVLNAKRFFKADSGLGKIFLGFFDGIKSVFTLKKPILFIAYTLGIWVCYWLTTYAILMAFDFTNHLGVAGSFSTLVFSTLGVIIPAPAGGAAIYSIYIGLNQIYSISIDQAKAIAIVMFSSNHSQRPWVQIVTIFCPAASPVVYSKLRIIWLPSTLGTILMSLANRLIFPTNSRIWGRFSCTKVQN
jgi:hypothetical protein